MTLARACLLKPPAKRVAGAVERAELLRSPPPLSPRTPAILCFHLVREALSGESGPDRDPTLLYSSSPLFLLFSLTRPLLFTWSVFVSVFLRVATDLENPEMSGKNIKFYRHSHGKRGNLN